ncbi:MAG: hypothetical protein WCP52_02190 [Bacteroidota bacterium]
MEYIPNQYGHIVLLNANGIPTRVATLKQGVTYNESMNGPKKITKVTIKSGQLEDEFYFFESGTPAFHNIQQDTGDSFQLKGIYLKYFTKETQKSAEGFIDFMCGCHFAIEGYTCQEYEESE